MRSTTRLIVLTLLLLTAITTVPSAKTIVLVRHAEKLAGDDPGLSVAGEARAMALARALRNADITHIITTQLRRTKLTAAPLATAEDIEITVVEVDYDASQHIKDVTRVIADLPDDANVLVVGHSNTIPHIVTALGGPPMSDFAHEEYSTMFIVNIKPHGGISFMKARFGEPDEDPDSDRPNP